MNLADFYKHKNIFITGGTGNIGMALVGKILLSFPEIGTLYLLVRSKKDKSAQQRSNEYIDDDALIHLKKLNVNLNNKIVWLEGELTQKNLGLSEESLQLVTQHVNIIFHSAATVKLAETMRTAIIVNIQGTQEVLNLAAMCVNLDCFMYISTIYTNTRKTVKYVEERYYPHPITPQELLHLAENNSREKLEEETPHLLNNDWLITYHYTKNAAENLVKQYETKFKIGVFRPGIVVESLSEPFPYSGKNISVITTMLMMATKGYVFKSDPKNQANCVPLDYTVNAIIAATQDAFQNNTGNSKIYHYSSNNNPFTFDELQNSYLEGFEDPENFIKLPKDKILQHATNLRISLVNKRTPKRWNKFEEINKLIHFVLWTTLHFECKNIETVWNNLSADDKKTFAFNINTVDWKRFFKNMYINTLCKNNFGLSEKPKLHINKNKL